MYFGTRRIPARKRRGSKSHGPDNVPSADALIADLENKLNWLDKSCIGKCFKDRSNAQSNPIGQP
jgi:hypothetical protein